MTFDTIRITSRQRIIEIISKYKLVTTYDLNTLLDMTSANIRHHLSTLVSDGLIEPVGIRKIGKGRPRKVYSMREQIFDDGLDRIMLSLISIWRSSQNQNDIQSLFDQVALKWVEENNNSLNKNLSQILMKCIERLNELSYHAHWEAGREGPLIRFENCPYKRIIRVCPELCGMDQVLLKKMVGIKFTQIMKLEPNDKGLIHCVFTSN